MVSFEPIAVTAFGMAVIFIETCGQMRATEIVPAIGLLKRFYLSATDTAKISVRHTITKPDKERELLIKFSFKSGFFFTVTPALSNRGKGLSFFLALVRFM
jgi:hypothetical protein